MHSLSVVKDPSFADCCRITGNPHHTARFSDWSRHAASGSILLLHSLLGKLLQHKHPTAGIRISGAHLPQ
jgi:hypothetical protein